MGQTHCTGPGAGQGQGTGLGTMGFYIMLCTVHTTQGKGWGLGIIVSFCTHPGPYPCPGPL